MTTSLASRISTSSAASCPRSIHRRMLRPVPAMRPPARPRVPSSARLLFLLSSSPRRSLVFFVRRASRQAPDPAHPDTGPQHHHPQHHSHLHHLHHQLHHQHCYSRHRHPHPASWLSGWADCTHHAKHHHGHSNHPSHPHEQPRLHLHHHQHSLSDLYHRIASLREQHAQRWASPARQQAIAAATALRVSLVARLREMSKPYTRSKPHPRDPVARKPSPEHPASPAAATDATPDAAPAAAHARPPPNTTVFSRVEDPYEDTEIDYITLKRVPKQSTPSPADANLHSGIETSNAQSHLQASVTSETADTAAGVEPSQANFSHGPQPDSGDAAPAQFQTPVDDVPARKEGFSSEECEQTAFGSVDGKVGEPASTHDIDAIRGREDFYIDEGLYGKVPEWTETPTDPPKSTAAVESFNEAELNAATKEEVTGAVDHGAAVSLPPSHNVDPISPACNTPLGSEPTELSNSAQTLAVPSGSEQTPDAKLANSETPSAAIDPPKLSPADLIASLRYYDRRRGTLPDEEPLSAQDIAILEALRKADGNASGDAHARDTWSSRAKKAGLVISSVVVGTYLVGVGNKLLQPQSDSSAAAEMLTAVQRSRAAK